jgi:hypothetical protein
MAFPYCQAVDNMLACGIRIVGDSEGAMILTSDLIFILLKVEADGGVGLQGSQLVDLLELVGADLVDVAGPAFKLSPKGRRVLAETSRGEAALVG